VKRINPPDFLKSVFIPNCPTQATALLVAEQWLKLGCQVAIVIGETLSGAENKCEDIAAIIETISSDRKVKFHSLDLLHEQNHPDAFDKFCERISLLSALRSIDPTSNSDTHILIATTPHALLGPCPILEYAEKTELRVRSGSELSYSVFSQELITKFDYSCEVVCEEPGQFAVRGGLIDIYPVNANFPVRIDFFGDTVEEIRSFDPTSQRTVSVLPEISISSMTDQYTADKDGEFFRYLPAQVFWHMEEPENLLRCHPLAFHETGNKASEKANLSLLWKRNPDALDSFLVTSEMDTGAGIFENSSICTLKIQPLLSELDQFVPASSNFLDSQQFASSTGKLLNSLSDYSKSGYSLLVSVGAEAEKKRIQSIFEENNLSQLKFSFVTVGLHQGFVYQLEDKPSPFPSFLNKGTSGLVMVASRELLGRERSRRPVRSRKARVNRKEVDQALDFAELVDGDLLVHLQHGICRFESLGKIKQDGKSEEAITVEFAEGILLHVPLQESHLLSRYIGLKKAKPKLAKLGGRAWTKTKEAAELAAIDLAADLLRLQASRDSEVGHAFSVDDQWQKEFEDLFPYTETPDQMRAILEVKEDMESERPMDRLVCGDVGYGKTEVAMRAAFKAIMDGKQVAILAPTTILCQQHLQNFVDRMSGFPVTIEMLSRFRTTGQQKKIIEGLASGAIDLVIGTHRMFSNDLKFKDLGLLIIDEEQRFGVEHKERLKHLKANLDVLTLSATPIPRTLYFAMVGVRSFSTIETAPTNRRPIRTEIIRHSDEMLKKAIDLEIRRGGQVFYLHNRVKTIHSVARKLQAIAPRLRIAIGHGQMSESELEEVMVDFISGKYDLLLCTTIIESGLDIPNCNTIIIEEADKFGLSQLYQLRGRVGRFTRQAYAYLMVSSHLPVKEKARKRLSALRSTSSMGAGFKIALRDLELRGAGNLLGSEQSGHIAGVGFEMYCKLLRESVSRLKGDEVSLRPSAVVRLDFLHTDETVNEDKDSDFIASCIPSTYVSEPRLRIELYRKVANIFEVSGILDLRDELLDRFGPIPYPVEALLLETEIKCLAQEAGFDCIASDGEKLFCRKVRKRSKEGIQYLRKFGNLPRIQQKGALLKLKEIIGFLKIHLHGTKLAV
jgi:transcription-repair coupling factor (superfamily II helicase)